MASHHMGWGGSDSWGWPPLPCPPVTTSWAHSQHGLAPGGVSWGEHCSVVLLLLKWRIHDWQNTNLSKNTGGKGRRERNSLGRTLFYCSCNHGNCTCNHGNCTFDLHTGAVHGPAAALDKNAERPERPDSLCHQALPERPNSLLRAQLSHQTLQWRVAMRKQRELVHKPGLWRSTVVFVHLICKLPGYKETGRKGDVTAWKYAMCAFDEYIWIIEKMETK